MPSDRLDHEPPAAGYRVRHGAPLRTGWRRIRAVSPLAFAPVPAGLLLLLLVLPAHRTAGREDGGALLVADSVALVSLGLTALLALSWLALTAYAAAVARDPVPMTPEPGTRVAFLAAYVPGREPLSAVRATLEGAVRMRHPGPLDVWLLDEGDDPEARMLCAELGVHHFTRLGVPEWNTQDGPHRAGREHGNLNAWIAKHGDAYDFTASVDTAHIPLPGFLERAMGYFRDPDTAFVVGPSVRGDQDFHALVQHAGNRYGTPVLAGPGSVVRITALRQAGGFQGPAAREPVTGFEIHRHRNPLTGRHWRSVHTPDVPAVGQDAGPLEDRSGGALLRRYGTALFRVPPGRLLSYTLVLVHRPVAAVTWLLAVLSCLSAAVHPAARPWAVTALVIVLAPAAARSFALPRARRVAKGRAPVVRPVQDTDHALAGPAGGS
ncbi:hypothetical protein [Streptomyces sp. NPDC056627]|uniref:hypothetical protein n=1 Tax=unclassified Streptomyces TaxID=2593676 RepID=UPI00093D79D6